MSTVTFTCKLADAVLASTQIDIYPLQHEHAPLFSVEITQGNVQFRLSEWPDEHIVINAKDNQMIAVDPAGTATFSDVHGDVHRVTFHARGPLTPLRKEHLL